MRSASLRITLLLVFLAGPASLSNGALTAWRTEVQVSAGSGVGTQFGFDGGLNDPFSSQTISRSGAHSEASAGLNASGYIPTLRTRATSTSMHAQAVAWGVQGYTNTGSVPLDTALIMRLTADITGGNDIDASVYLFQEANFEFYRDSGTMLFESNSELWPGFEDFANNLGPTGFDIDLKNHTGPVDELRTFNFTVQPGESFYVWAMMAATADNPGVVDAFSTLTASFTNTNGLSPAAVPEPTSALLLSVGAVFLLRRRCRANGAN